MPKREARNPTSAKGDWFIDDRCIDCAASREVAPGLIVERGGKSVFARQQNVNRLRPMDQEPRFHHQAAPNSATIIKDETSLQSHRRSSLATR
jgi:hypothetical protein